MVTNLQRAVAVPVAKIRSVAGSVRRHLRLKGEVSIVFVGEGRMRAVNRRFLGHDYVTDVITFEAEIVICPQEARRNAARHGNSVGKELLLYVVHGLLHLAGYDDKRERDIRRMRQKEEQLMRRYA